MKRVTIYTDGACSGNPGKGGWSAILSYNGNEKILSGGCQETTNNKMELTGVIMGLKALKEPCEVYVHSDSNYVVKAFTENWIVGWQAKGWKKKNDFIPNVELWQELFELTNLHKVTFCKVKGHSDDEYNNKCDKLARDEILKLQ